MIWRNKEIKQNSVNQIHNAVRTLLFSNEYKLLHDYSSKNIRKYKQLVNILRDTAIELDNLLND